MVLKWNTEDCFSGRMKLSPDGMLIYRKEWKATTTINMWVNLMLMISRKFNIEASRKGGKWNNKCLKREKETDK